VRQSEALRVFQLLSEEDWPESDWLESRHQYLDYLERERQRFEGYVGLFEDEEVRLRFAEVAAIMGDYQQLADQLEWTEEPSEESFQWALQLNSQLCEAVEFLQN
jgi:hypothetical protein